MTFIHIIGGVFAFILVLIIILEGIKSDKIRNEIIDMVESKKSKS